MGIRCDYYDDGEDYAYTSTDDLVDYGIKKGYDVIYFSQIPSDSGAGPDFDELFINNTALIKDPLREGFDYGTGPARGTDIFDKSTLGGFSYKAMCIPGNKENEYMKNVKNRVGKIKWMSPDRYYSYSAKILNTTVDDLKEQRGFDKDYIEKLKNVILKDKKKFPMTFIDFADNEQEGLHRMYVAGELFGWDTRFPVLVIDKNDPLREELLLELNRNQLITKSKKSDNYKDQSKGKNRWERRNRSKIDRRVDQYNKIDMNSFFKKDELKVGINVHGETDDYVVTIRFNNALKAIADEIKRNNNKLEFKCVLIALQRTFNNGDVFVSCSCPD